MMRALAMTGFCAALVAAAALAQPPGGIPGGGSSGGTPADKDKKPNLEELLTKALQHSPEVQVAEAKLKEAEAMLRQTRLDVARRLVDLHTTMDQQQRSLALAESEWKRVLQMRGTGTVSAGEVNETERKLMMIKSQVTQLESQVNALTGRLPVLANFQGLASMPAALGGGAGGIGGALPVDDGRPPPRLPRGSMAEKMRAALDKPMKLENAKFQQIPLAEVMEFVRDRSGVEFLINLGDKSGEQVTINYVGQTTVGGFLQILSDVVPDLRIGVRDYGFLITINGSQPDDTMMFMDFWRGGAEMKSSGSAPKP